MAGCKDQPKHLVADVIIKRRVQIGHRLLLRFQFARNHLVFTREHAGTAQVVQGAAFGRRHQPRPRPFRNAAHRPMLERRQQRVLRQLLRQRHITQHFGKAGDKARLLDPPDGKNCALDFGGHRRRFRLARALARTVKRADLTGAFPFGHVLEVELHELSWPSPRPLPCREARRPHNRRRLPWPRRTGRRSR